MNSGAAKRGNGSPEEILTLEAAKNGLMRLRIYDFVLQPEVRGTFFDTAAGAVWIFFPAD